MERCVRSGRLQEWLRMHGVPDTGTVATKATGAVKNKEPEFVAHVLLSVPE